MLRSDPNAAHFPIDPERLDLVEEFLRTPRGPHSLELQLVLNRMRWSGAGRRHVVLTLEPGRRWMLARLPERRGQPLERLPNRVFGSIAEAERAVFVLRWEALTGRRLPDRPPFDTLSGAGT